MAGLNKIILIGNLGRDVEMRFTPSGKPVADFSLAVSEKKGETEWFNITVWNKTAELCNQYLMKGSTVCLEGRINLQQWEDDKGKHSKSVVTANHVVFLSKTTSSHEESSGEGDLDSIPF